MSGTHTSDRAGGRAVRAEASTVYESHRMVSETYGEAAMNERICREWYQRFKNGDFPIEDRLSGGRSKGFEDEELEHLFDEDSCQTQEELARSLGSASPPAPAPPFEVT
ncbi:Mariner Mos1 transposase [Eumeta japonica]|uniref:Mariner Mos1 transposase n=1 Tax=Eumeta variegata TaxID=151549 RepID=A0A4C1X520_EUMVA|nr:Mariner Mos1 transposase [Eumeta japonica]